MNEMELYMNEMREIADVMSFGLVTKLRKKMAYRQSGGVQLSYDAEKENKANRHCPSQFISRKLSTNDGSKRMSCPPVLPSPSKNKKITNSTRSGISSPPQCPAPMPPTPTAKTCNSVPPLPLPLDQPMGLDTSFYSRHNGDYTQRSFSAELLPTSYRHDSTNSSPSRHQQQQQQQQCQQQQQQPPRRHSMTLKRAHTFGSCQMKKSPSLKMKGMVKRLGSLHRNSDPSSSHSSSSSSSTTATTTSSDCTCYDPIEYSLQQQHQRNSYLTLSSSPSTIKEVDDSTCTRYQQQQQQNQYILDDIIRNSTKQKLMGNRGEAEACAERDSIPRAKFTLEPPLKKTISLDSRESSFSTSTDANTMNFKLVFDNSLFPGQN
ncbi:unnamed protein product [Ambrosiozyma monospora]|uniref:Unnamed protein product n=1 Tax=Ambrosiozyma monospora TaxID=43982 RepID=A0ACB5T9G7_AMBMO|nr:unnamed protein product [Ambrosiozyma monospora]